jgi:hypothetical protein
VRSSHPSGNDAIGVELIAETRWTPRGEEIGLFLPPGTPTTNPLLAMVAPGLDEAVLAQFSSAIAMKGYGRSERLLPQGFPALAHQPLYRYRQTTVEEGKSSPIYQLGVGAFSAHAIPPYSRSEVRCSSKLLMTSPHTLRLRI